MRPEVFLLDALILIAGPILVWMIPLVRKYLPLVVIQIAWGFILGPSVTGRHYPDAFAFLWPDAAISSMGIIGTMAAIIFVFLTGLHLDPVQLLGRSDQQTHGHSQKHVKKFWTIAILSIVVPGILGITAATWLWSEFPILRGASATLPTFLFGMGLAAGVTALPVLSAILIQSERIDTKLGKFVLSCATLHDGVLWILLTGLLASIGQNGAHGSPPQIFLLASMYLCTMIFAIRPMLARLMKSAEFHALPDFVKLSLTVIGLLISAYVTERIGVHYLLGAVVYGAVLPRQARDPLKKRVQDFVLAVLLPFFFAAAGLKCDISMSAPEVWIVFSLMTVVVFMGQFIGSSLPAKAFGDSWRDALSIGTYMSSKGIVEIVVLSILLQAGILSPTSYAAMIIMAVVVTGLTKPMIDIIERRKAV